MTGLLFAILLWAQGIPQLTQPVQPGSISGQIFSLDGKPAAGVSVGALALRDAQTGPALSVVSVVQTGGDGRYLLQKLPPGRYYIEAGLMDRPNYFPGVAEQGSANLVALNEGVALDGINFPMVVPSTLMVDGHEITAILKMIHLSSTPKNGISEVLTALRTRLSLRYLVAPANVIFVRDTPQRIAFADRVVAEFDQVGQKAPSSESIGMDAGGNLYALDADSIRNVTPSRSQLLVGIAGPLSLEMNENARDTYASLAEMAGLNVIFDPEFVTGGKMAFKVDNIDILDALDLLSRKTGNFWQVWDSKTIVVAPDTLTKHRREPQILKTIYLNTNSPVVTIEILTSLRTLLNMRYLVQSAQTRALVMRDTPNQVALAEKIIAVLDPPVPAGVARAALPVSAIPVSMAFIDVGGGSVEILALDGDSLHDAVRPPSQLQPKDTSPISMNFKGDARTAFETLAEMAGIRIRFAPAFMNGPPMTFRVANVGILNALDLLSLQTGSLWQVVDASTITVAPDTIQSRKDIDPEIPRTFYLADTITHDGITEIVNALRTLFSLKQIEQNDSAKSIVMVATANVIALAEKIVADLDRPKR